MIYARSLHDALTVPACRVSSLRHSVYSTFCSFNYLSLNTPHQRLSVGQSSDEYHLLAVVSGTDRSTRQLPWKRQKDRLPRQSFLMSGVVFPVFLNIAARYSWFRIWRLYPIPSDVMHQAALYVSLKLPRHPIWDLERGEHGIVK